MHSAFDAPGLLVLSLWCETYLLWDRTASWPAKSSIVVLSCEPTALSSHSSHHHDGEMRGPHGQPTLPAQELGQCQFGGQFLSNQRYLQRVC
jgi:hypothetical protein